VDKEVNIHVPILARVEGEGSLELKIKNQSIESLQLRIFEPPRLFEKFLEGRHVNELPDMVARICGICPVAYQMSAVHAIESLAEFQAPPWLHELRRLLYCGEWIESHALHIHLLAVPDFLGFGNVIEMAKQYPEEVNRGLTLQSVGNDIIKLLGARSVHPVGVKMGGFHHIPDKSEFQKLLDKIEAAIPAAEDMLAWTISLDRPAFKHNLAEVSLYHDKEYPMNQGNLISSDGLNIPITDFEAHFQESQVLHSTAFHSHLNQKPYLLGPLARLNLNYQHLPGQIHATLTKHNHALPSSDLFNNMVARSIELLYALHEARRIIKSIDLSDTSTPKLTLKAGIATGCTEAPRGTLWHRYKINKEGYIQHAKLVPPTSQNQAHIEHSLKQSLTGFGLQQTPEVLQHYAEQMIRNYDPCISCATHFLKMSIIHET
jgi:sulfhydrogenase subunit alpha